MRNGVYVMGDTMKVNERSYTGTLSTTTDARGRFSFAPSTDAYSIIVVEDAGYVEVKMADLKAEGEVRLQPWARIEGKLMIGTKPGAGEDIHLNAIQHAYANHPRNFPALSFHARTTTDGEGNFVFAKAPPIMMTLYRSPKSRDGRMGTVPQAQTTKVELSPGKTERITLGGRGRPVIGKFVVNGYEGKIDWRADVQNLEAKPEKPDGLPDMLAMSRALSEKFKSAKTDDEKTALRAEMETERKAALEKTIAFYRSPAGIEYSKKQSRDALVFQQDGTFRIEDVPGGKYMIRLELHEGGKGDSVVNRFNTPLIARLEKDVEIPGAAGERSDEPFDLGVIEVAAKTVLKTGKAASTFEVKTVDGKPLRLSDYKGKYVLLDFWAVWCGPCVAETPFLKETYEAFKDDPRFAMVGLSLDPEADAPIQYSKKNKLGWTQGFLGDWSKSDVPNQFGVEGIPAIFLLGPDGTILKKDLRGDMIKAAVQSALGGKN
jgi:thiol-disulfide isomerase/thioredoxin